MEINREYPCNAVNYRKRRRDSIRYIVIHYVGASGTAKNNAAYYSRANVGASAHYFVGHASEDGAVYESVAPECCAWHCGSETGIYYSECRNDSSIGIELCCHQNGNGVWYFDDVTVDRAVELTRELMREYGIDAEHVIRHYDVTHKVCPAPFVEDERAWEEFKNRLREEEKEEVGKTVYSLNDVHAQVIDTWNFKIAVCDTRKQSVGENNYFNLGYFAQGADGNTIPVGNLVVDGQIITDAANQADWLNTARHRLTTLVVHYDNTAEFVQVEDMMQVPTVKYAVSGIPIIRNGYRVSMEEIKEEGYFGNECYRTWHGFLGIREGRLVYVAAETEFELMVYLLEVMGIRDAIKVDGGGSFILHNGGFEVATGENRRINNVGIWEG